MKRQRRTRRPRRQGVRHVSDLLAILMNEIEPVPSMDDCQERRSGTTGLITSQSTVDTGQSTFSFYQPVGGNALTGVAGP